MGTQATGVSRVGVGLGPCKFYNGFGLQKSYKKLNQAFTMYDEFCEDCGLVYDIGITPTACDDVNTGIRTGRRHDVEYIVSTPFYIWDKTAYGGFSSGSGISKFGWGSGRGMIQKERIWVVDLDDFASNLKQARIEIFNYLKKNSVTEEVIIIGTLEQNANARTTQGGPIRYDHGIKTWVLGTPFRPMPKRRIRVHNDFIVLSQIDVKYQIMIRDPTTNVVFLIVRT